MGIQSYLGEEWSLVLQDFRHTKRQSLAGLIRIEVTQAKVKCVLHNVQKSTLIKFVPAFSEDCGKSSGVSINFSNQKFLLLLPDFSLGPSSHLRKKKIETPAHQCSFFSFTYSATWMYKSTVVPSVPFAVPSFQLPINLR